MHVPMLAVVSVPDGQGLKQIGELALAFGLCALIGLEREWRMKSAGLRTHTLVGFGAALFVIVSKYGFTDVLGPHVTLDPSRVAAQVVSGLGFIGGGLIFVRRDAVRGLTTAATLWLDAAIGMACGAGLAILALFATAVHFVVVFGLRWVSDRMPRSSNLGFGLRVVYEDGRGVLREVLARCTDLGFTIERIGAERIEGTGGHPTGDVEVRLELFGGAGREAIAGALGDLEGVHEVVATGLADVGD
jgi:putative Mg2+ transporter-C (MgtC) family protein